MIFSPSVFLSAIKVCRQQIAIIIKVYQIALAILYICVLLYIYNGIFCIFCMQVCQQIAIIIKVKSNCFCLQSTVIVLNIAQSHSAYFLDSFLCVHILYRSVSANCHQHKTTWWYGSGYIVYWITIIPKPSKEAQKFPRRTFLCLT